MKTSNYKALGQGLSALINDKSLLREDLGQKVILNIPIEEIFPNRKQPRKEFAEKELQELAESIVSHGIIQPIIVDKEGNNKYQIIAGERRWRAAAIANLKEIPVIVKNNDAQENIEISLIENIQRQDLNPIEEADVYIRLLEEYNYTHADLAKKLGKSRSHISNYIRLTYLDEDFQQLIAKGQISVGHAKLLLTVENPQDYIKEIIAKDLSVRELEKLISQKATGRTIKAVPKQADQKELADLAKIISEKLKIEAKIKIARKGGKLELKFDDLAKLDLIITLLCEEKNIKF
jgi:ParB family chromosome partitioning protein